MTGTTFLFVTRRVAPARCGVGDFTVALARELVRRGKRVVVVTGADQNPELEGLSYWNQVEGWGRRGVESLHAFARSQGPSRIFFQWVPFLYHHWGWNPWPAFGAWRGRLCDVPWDVMVHEPFVDYAWGRAGVMGLGQRLCLWPLGAAADRLFTPVSHWRQWLDRDFPGWSGKVRWLPSGTPVPPSSANPEAGLFGVFHPMGAGKNPEALVTAWTALRAQMPQSRLLVLGAELPSLPLPLREDPRVQCMGYLASDALARQLSRCQVFLAPFVDGISARRTSALAALACGVPVVSQGGRLTDSVFTEGAVVLAGPTASDLAAEARSLACDPARARAQGERGRALYEGVFRWERLGEIYLEGLE